jgi:protein-tyrosine phosphatase
VETIQSFKVLYLCAGNTGRSPIAEACMWDYVEGRNTPVRWEVGSAGTQAEEGEPVRSEALKAGDSLGMDLSDHKSRQLVPEDVDASDLILAMSWEQAAHVWSLAPGSWGKCFTLKEFVHWAKQAPTRPSILFPDRVAQMRDRVEQAHTVRRRARADHGIWGSLRPQDLNVVEPDGKGDAAWRNAAQAVRTLVVDVAHLLGGP